MPPTNRAAFLPGPKAALEVRVAPYPAPTENEIVVKNRAIAVNPVDWLKQVVGDLMFPWIKYPFVLGNDLSGSIAELGSGLGPGRFKIGDRVVGHAVGMDPKINRSAEGAFQEYTVVRANMTAVIPKDMGFEEACVLPLCLSTAACGLFQQDYLGLRPPVAAVAARKGSDDVVLVWGGSTSVGSNGTCVFGHRLKISFPCFLAVANSMFSSAIQLAVAAGYKVVTTCSPKNFDYVKSLGTSRTFDYNSKTVVQDIITFLSGKTIAGAIAIGNNSTESLITILSKLPGKKFVAQASFPCPDKIPTSTLGIIGLLIGVVWWNIKVLIMSKFKGVKTKFIFGSELVNNEVSRMVYEDFLPQALEEGSFVPAPKPLVVGKGLEDIQEALNLHMQGVSARKIVVSLPSHT
jgi:NADPH:quinone reductase-like Zn-dependent oxidoreductase